MSVIPHGKLGGCLPREVPFGQGPFPCLPQRGTDGTPVVLSWKAIEAADGELLRRNKYWPYRPDQKHLPACTCGMNVNSMGFLRAIEGKDTPLLAMAGLFAFEGIRFIKDGKRELFELIPRRRVSGSGLLAMKLIAQVVGIPPAEINGEKYIDPLDWEGFRENRWPGDWMEQAAKYRFSEECYDTPNCQAGCSQVVSGFAFERGMDNHAVLQATLGPVAGTWGRGYGDDGYHPWGNPMTAYGRRQINEGIAQYGGLCSRATRPDDEPPAEGLRGLTPFEPDDEEGRRRRFGRGRIWRGRR